MPKNIKICLFREVEKSQNKVGVPEEIGCGNNIVLSKIGRGNEQRKTIDIQINRQIDRHIDI